MGRIQRVPACGRGTFTRVLRVLLLASLGVATCVGCLSLDVDPQGQAPVSLSAVQWEASDADSETLLEKGCAHGRPTVHAKAGQRVRLELRFETVKRRAGLTNDACDTGDDLSRKAQTEVLAPTCYEDFVPAGPARLISFETIPAGAAVEGSFAKASGYSYVFEASRSGKVQHRYAPGCSGVDDSETVAELIVEN